MGRKKAKHSQKNCSSVGVVHENKNNVTKEKEPTNCNESVHKDINTNIESVLSETKHKVQEATNKKDELTFKSYMTNTQRYQGREYFVHSLCQICKKGLEKRVSCSKCSLVNYCSEDHKKLHWPEHAELCTAIQAVCRARGQSHLLQSGLHCSPEEFRALRYRNMLDCQTRVERPLDSWEKEMFIFPNICGRCYQYKMDALLVCESCGHSAFCLDHKSSSSHSQWCPHLLKYKIIVQDQTKYGIIYPTIPPCDISSALPKLKNMEDAFKNIRNQLSELEFVELTEIVTYPLTVLNVLLMFDKSKTLNTDKLVLHIIGAERDFEINRIEKWEYYVLHVIPQVKSLEIEFIGPELNFDKKPASFKVCHYCDKADKSICYKFHNQLYHTLTEKSNFSKPNLICVFNPGLYRTTGFNGQDSWSPTIVSMFAKDCPVLITSYTHKEIYLDVDRVKSTLNIKMEKEPTLNPFSSQKPSLNFVSDEESPVIFKNNFYCIVSKT